METTHQKIAARLEDAFVRRGFAEPGVAELREAADVSLRTLYRHFPSRDDMIAAALEHRHARYLAYLFDNLPEAPDAALAEVFERVGAWMETEGRTVKGCLFMSAVAAKPDNEALAALLSRHKKEVASRLAAVGGLPGRETDLLVLHEGLTAAHATRGREAVAAAIRFARALQQSAGAEG